MFDKKLTSEVQGLRSSHEALSQGVQALQQASLLGAIGQHCQCWRTLLAEERLGDPRRLERYGHKCCSQNEEDGILLEIFNGIGVRHRTHRVRRRRRCREQHVVLAGAGLEGAVDRR
jgi:hypothetical protein